MEEQDSLIDTILDAINSKEGSQKLKNMKDVVLFIGTSGNGTSTMVKLLSGDQFLYSKGEEGRYVIIDKEGRIGDPTKSSLTKTVDVEPVWFSGLEKETCYFDCPGFANTISPHADIMSTIATRNALRGRRHAKIILVVSYQEVKTGGQRSAFLDLVQYVSEFVKDIKKFKNSIALFVTKVPNIVVNMNGTRQLLPDEKLKESIVEFLENVRSVVRDLNNVPSEKHALFKNVSLLIDILLSPAISKDSRTSKIGILRYPENAGLLNMMPTFSESAVNLNSIVKNNLEFTAITDEDFGYTVSPDSKAALSDDVKNIVDTFRSHLNNIFREFTSDYQTLEKSTNDIDIIRHVFADHQKIWQKTAKQLNDVTATIHVLECLLDHVEQLFQTEAFKRHNEIVRQNSTYPPKIVKKPEEKIQQTHNEEYNLAKDYYNDISEANEVIKVLKRKLQEANGEVMPNSYSEPKVTQTSHREKQHKITLFERKEKLQECIKLMALLQTVVAVEFNLSTTKLQAVFKKLADYVHNTYNWYTTIIPIIFDQICSYELQSAKNGSMRKFIDTLYGWAKKSDDSVITTKQLVDASANGIRIPIELNVNAPKVMQLHKICQSVLRDPQIAVKDNVLRVTGVCVSLSSLANRLNPTIREIEIFASSRIFIDCDLNLTGSGISLFIAAPKWEVIGERRSIILDGKLRDNYAVPKNVCSGSFFGVGGRMFNSERLAISTCACNGVRPMNDASENDSKHGLIGKCKTYLSNDNKLKPLKDGFHAGLALLIGFQVSELSVLTVWNNAKIKEMNNCRCNLKNYRRSLTDYHDWFNKAEDCSVFATDTDFKSLLSSITSNKSPKTVQSLLNQHIEIMTRLRTKKATWICRASNALLLHDIFSFLASTDNLSAHDKKVLCCLFVVCVFQYYSNFFESFDIAQLDWINILSNFCMGFLEPTNSKSFNAGNYANWIDKLYYCRLSYDNLFQALNGGLLTSTTVFSEIYVRECINYFSILLKRIGSTSANTAQEAYQWDNNYRY